MSTFWSLPMTAPRHKTWSSRSHPFICIPKWQSHRLSRPAAMQEDMWVFEIDETLVLHCLGDKPFAQLVEFLARERGVERYCDALRVYSLPCIPVGPLGSDCSDYRDTVPDRDCHAMATRP